MSDSIEQSAKQSQNLPQMNPELALQVLTADNGKLARQLDTAAQGGTPDGNISQGDIMAYLGHAGKPTDQTSALQDEALVYLLKTWDFFGKDIGNRLGQVSLTNVLMENSGEIFDEVDSGGNTEAPDGKISKADVDAFLKRVNDDPSYAQRFDPEQIKEITDLQKNWASTSVCNLKEDMKPVGFTFGGGFSVKNLLSYKKGAIEFDPSSGDISRDSLAAGIGLSSSDELDKFVSDNKYLEMTPAFDQSDTSTDSTTPAVQTSDGGDGAAQNITRDSQGRVTEVDAGGATETISYVGDTTDVQQVQVNDPSQPATEQQRVLTRTGDQQYELAGGTPTTVQERIQCDQNGDLVITFPDGSTKIAPALGASSKS